MSDTPLDVAARLVRDHAAELIGLTLEQRTARLAQLLTAELGAAQAEAFPFRLKRIVTIEKFDHSGDAPRLIEALVVSDDARQVFGPEEWKART